MNITSEIEKLLKSLNIDYYIFEHEPTPTSKDSAKVRQQLKDYNIDEKNGAAAILLRSKGNFFMCVLPGCYKIDFKKVKEIIGNKSVSLASKEEVEQVTHCKPGGVPPFGNLFNIPLYVDEKLLKNEHIAFNAGTQTVSIIMKSKDYLAATKAKVEDFIAE